MLRSSSTMNTLASLILAQSEASWHPATLGQGLLYTIVYALLGIALAIAGYKLFDACTPGRLHEEILQNRNTAAAMVGGAVIVGVCIIVAAAIVG